VNHVEDLEIGQNTRISVQQASLAGYPQPLCADKRSVGVAPCQSGSRLAADREPALERLHVSLKSYETRAAQAEGPTHIQVGGNSCRTSTPLWSGPGSPRCSPPATRRTDARVAQCNPRRIAAHHRPAHGSRADEALVGRRVGPGTSLMVGAPSTAVRRWTRRASDRPMAVRPKPFTLTRARPPAPRAGGARGGATQPPPRTHRAPHRRPPRPNRAHKRGRRRREVRWTATPGRPMAPGGYRLRAHPPCEGPMGEGTVFEAGGRRFDPVRARQSNQAVPVNTLSRIRLPCAGSVR
jgi:hypothetical protein